MLYISVTKAATCKVASRNAFSFNKGWGMKIHLLAFWHYISIWYFLAYMMLRIPNGVV